MAREPKTDERTIINVRRCADIWSEEVDVCGTVGSEGPKPFTGPIASNGGVEGVEIGVVAEDVDELLEEALVEYEITSVVVDRNECGVDEGAEAEEDDTEVDAAVWSICALLLAPNPSQGEGNFGNDR